MSRSVSVAVLGFWALFVATLPAVAQEGSYDRIEETRSTAAYFYHARPGVPTIQVSVWGTVPRPGVYEVREGTHIDRLMTLAGGAPIEARSENEEADITIRLFRGQQQGARELVYEAPLEKLLRDTDVPPSVQAGDVLVVETRVESGFNWRDVLGIVGSVGSLALVVERIFFR